SIVLFLKPSVGSSKQGEPGSKSNTPVKNTSQVSSKHDVSSPITPEPNKVIPPEEPSCLSGGNDVSNVSWGDESEEFTLVLDCCDLTHEIYIQCSLSPSALNAQPLQFHTDRWSLQIRKEGIWYETKHTGGSVRWMVPTICCVYTMGSPIINQQSPLPVPGATCFFSLLGSDFLQWDYYVTIMLASSFTIAVGRWQEAGVKDPNFEVEKTNKPYAKEPRYLKSNDMVLPLLPLCLTAAHSILGVHPFSRLDVLIVSSGFSSLGMASPHIVFLSQSMLTGERNLCGVRLCHEIAHSWFGLAIGAQDWMEEWINNGFATYLEDNTGEVSESGGSVMKHALNPEKPFMQVHYLKGYFLLKFLADQVGEEKFLHFFKVFVGKFHGQLNLSQVILYLFQYLLNVSLFSFRQGIAPETIFSDWLDTPEMPKWLRDACSEWLRTPAVQEVKGEVAKWIHFSGCGGKGSNPEQLLSLSMLRLLQTTNNLQAQDAEVKHRWSELVVKYKHTAYDELMVQEDEMIL
uniref:Aminopeptidase O (putative) n=1 Tax=Cyprinus carpio TaxID=7962 RepID=A0A8C2KS84_CYPCA